MEAVSPDQKAVDGIKANQIQHRNPIPALSQTGIPKGLAIAILPAHLKHLADQCHKEHLKATASLNRMARHSHPVPLNPLVHRNQVEHLNPAACPPLLHGQHLLLRQMVFQAGQALVRANPLQSASLIQEAQAKAQQNRFPIHKEHQEPQERRTAIACPMAQAAHSQPDHPALWA